MRIRMRRQTLLPVPPPMQRRMQIPQLTLGLMPEPLRGLYEILLNDP